MATKDEHTAGQTQHQTTEHKPAKLADDFVANEPHTPIGPELTPKHLERAAVEALHSLRPQPTAREIDMVLEKLAEVDDKGKPKVVVKSAKEGGEKAVAALNEGRK